MTNVKVQVTRDTTKLWLPIGSLVGCTEGWLVGCAVGCDGRQDGWLVGWEGRLVGCAEGRRVGSLVGCTEGWLVGCAVGCDGRQDGWLVGRIFSLQEMDLTNRLSVNYFRTGAPSLFLFDISLESNLLFGCDCWFFAAHLSANTDDVAAWTAGTWLV